MRGQHVLALLGSYDLEYAREQGRQHLLPDLYNQRTGVLDQRGNWRWNLRVEMVA